MRLKPEKMCPEAVTWSDLISQICQASTVSVCVLTYLMWRSQKDLESPFSAQDNVFHIRIHPKEWISWDLCNREMNISVFWKSGLMVWLVWLAWMASVFEGVRVLRWQLKPASKVQRSLHFKANLWHWIYGFCIFILENLSTCYIWVFFHLNSIALCK